MPARLISTGPLWLVTITFQVMSDIPRNENLRYLEEDDHVSRMFRSPSMHSNGNTFDYRGRQISFCHGSRDVRRYEHDGSITVLAAKNDEGKELNAPNDGMVHPNDGAIWFTDPGYGAFMHYEGKRYSTDNVQPFIKEAVYRIDAQSSKATKITDEPFKPNGICFSADYKAVYVETRGAHST